jgi:hypothetical protein
VCYRLVHDRAQVACLLLRKDEFIERNISLGGKNERLKPKFYAITAVTKSLGQSKYKICPEKAPMGRPIHRLGRTFGPASRSHIV